MMRNYRYKLIQTFLVLTGLLGLQLVLTLYIRMNPLPREEPRVEKVEAFNPTLFQIMSFGQGPAVIDWMWIKALQDNLLTHVPKGVHPAIYYTLDLITDLDPAFKEAYIGGATLLSVVRDDGFGALHELVKAEAFRKAELPHYSEEFHKNYWSDDWQIPFLAAYVYVFDLQDMPRAARMFRATAQEKGSPAYLKGLVEKLDKVGGQYQVVMQLIDFMLKSQQDPQVLERLAKEKGLVKVNYFVFQINENFKQFLEKKHLDKAKLDRHQKEALFENFMKTSNTLWTDQWGGRLFFDENNRISTSTPHRKVFGLE